ncbi:cell envelope integrity protein TolA [Salmonella enterica subsp. enterica serovar Saintpaul]|nr:cell envelope integrity protein TolA [Salmonella enterica subsp. enterica serovar Saintpaul]
MKSKNALMIYFMYTSDNMRNQMKISNHVIPSSPFISINNVDAQPKSTATKFNEQLKDVNQTSQMPHKKHNFIHKGIRAALHAISAIRILLSHKHTPKDNVQTTERFGKIGSVRHNSQSDALFSNNVNSASASKPQSIEIAQRQKSSIPQPPPLPLPVNSATPPKAVGSLADAISKANLKHAQHPDVPVPTNKGVQVDFMAQLKARLSSMHATDDKSNTGKPMNKIQQEIAELKKEYQSPAAVQKREEAEAKMEARVSAAIKAEEDTEAKAQAVAQTKAFVAEVKHDAKGIPLPPPMPVGLLSTQQGKPQIPPENTAKIKVASKGQYNIDPEMAKKHGSLVSELNALFAKRANENHEVHHSEKQNDTGNIVAVKEVIEPNIDEGFQSVTNINLDLKGIPVPPPLPLN